MVSGATDSELLERRPDSYTDVTPWGVACDFTPWCVNVTPWNTIHEGAHFVEPDWDFKLMDCWEYNEQWGQERAEGCRWDT